MNMGSAELMSARERQPVRFDDAFLHDPYPSYRRLRESGRVHWCDEAFNGAWIVTHHADVEMVLRDTRFSSQRTRGWVKRIPGIEAYYSTAEERANLASFQRNYARAMVFLDGADHARVRQALAASFHPATVRQFLPCIDEMLAGLLDSLDGPAGFDFIEAVARPLPAQVISLLLGIERADISSFCSHAENLATFIGALQPTAGQLVSAQQSLHAMIGYFDAVIPGRRRRPGIDMVSRLVCAESEGGLRADGELAVQCAMLLFAGQETTRNLLGNTLQLLLSHREAWARVRADPDWIRRAIREALRYESPVQYTGRRVAAGLELHGRQLQRGDLVLAMIGAANRDPARFADPDRFDIDRAEGSHLAFGCGAHVCLGASVALLETEAALREVVRRWPGLHETSPAIRWNGIAGLRGPASLMVRG